MRLTWLIRIFAITGWSIWLLGEASAQYYRTVPAYPVPRPPTMYPSRGAIVGNGIQQGYNWSQQGAQIRQWQQDQRQNWVLDQQLKQRWLMQQQQLQALQRQQQNSFVRPYPNSTPMFMPPANQQVYQQNSQAWQRQYYSRQQTLQRWQMQPLPRW